MEWQKGYQLAQPYVREAEITYVDQNWVYERDRNELVPSPKEFRHTLSDIVNGLVDTGFVIRHMSDSCDIQPDVNAEPGTWDHFVAYAPPWLAVWAALDSE